MKPTALSILKPAKLSDSAHRRLNSYALAAGAGILALTGPAEARIVYTRAHKSIVPNSMVPLDLNHDGESDFTFRATFGPTSNGEDSAGRLSVLPARRVGNQVAGNTGQASALSAGVRIGPQTPFSKGRKVMAYGGFDAGTSGPPFCAGPWHNVTNRYLGLKFAIHGKTHFGWARLTVSCDLRTGAPSGFLTGYAYETVPNKTIITGKTRESGHAIEESSEALAPPTGKSVLGLLAIGSPGVSIRRLEESMGAAQSPLPSEGQHSL